MGPYKGRALLLLASTAPIGVTIWMLHAFAGRSTSINVSIVTSVSLAANVMMGGSRLVDRNKGKKKNDELNRLRARCQVLEEQLSESRATVPNDRKKG